MVYKKGEYNTDIAKNFKGGAGEFRIEHILNQEQLGKSGRLFAWGTLKPGDSVGSHAHEKDVEVCCFVSGNGTVKETGNEIPVGPGDVNFVGIGQEHEIVNTGDQDLVYIACVLFP